MGSYWRSPKTKNEMTHYYATVENDLGIRIKIRGRRRPHNLNFAWDDFHRQQYRNWKTQRRTQYKRVEIILHVFYLALIKNQSSLILVDY